jgi:hypothetical protein
MSRLKVKPGEEKHTLEVRLTAGELKQLGEIPEKQDSAEVLKT